MKKNKIMGIMMAGVFMISAMNPTHVHASEEQIAAAYAEREAAEAGLYAAQNQISNLEAKQQAMESYLAELNVQYDQLTQEISELSIQAGLKEEDLKKIEANLESAETASKKQYESMKIRIAYLYENGSSSVLEMLLSSENMADFMNRAENIRQISEYDQRMFEKYLTLQEEIKAQEVKAEEEIISINALLQMRAEKQKEVESLAASTNESIASYAYQISASQAEANALIAQIQAADQNISSLLIQQAAAQAAAEAAAQAAQAAAQQETYDSSYTESYEGTYEESYSDSYAEDTYDDYSYDSYEESSSYDSYEEPASESYSESYQESSSSGSGTYLGTFTLTAYCNCATCCGTAGNLTASGTVPTAGRTVAMAGVPFGTQLLINGNVYTVEDLGTPYGHVDIFMDSHSAALQFGLQSAEVYQLN